MDGPPSPSLEEEEDKFNLVRRSPYYEEVDQAVSGTPIPLLTLIVTCLVGEMSVIF